MGRGEEGWLKSETIPFFAGNLRMLEWLVCDLAIGEYQQPI
jgi:hypothetical protein